MKQVKKLALFATVALSTMSCSNNEVMDSLRDQNEIRFSGVQMGNSIITKATAGDDDSFGVYAYKTSATATTWFENQQLAKRNGTWVLPTKFYYPTGNFSMNFWAYGKIYNTNIPTSVSAAGLVYTDYTIDQTNATVHEAFVISKEEKTVTQADKATAIALNFWHALSKIQFTAKISSSAGYENVDAKITSISINTCSTGSITYTGSASKWTQGTMTDQEITLTNLNALTTTGSDVTSSFYVIPLGDDQTNTITVKADLYHKGTSIKVADQLTGIITATGTQLAINNSVTYNITLDLSQAGLAEITFAEPTIEEWKPVNDATTTIPVKP